MRRTAFPSGDTSPNIFPELKSNVSCITGAASSGTLTSCCGYLKKPPSFVCWRVWLCLLSGVRNTSYGCTDMLCIVPLGHGCAVCAGRYVGHCRGSNRVRISVIFCHAHMVLTSSYRWKLIKGDLDHPHHFLNFKPFTSVEVCSDTHVLLAGIFTSQSSVTIGRHHASDRDRV